MSKVFVIDIEKRPLNPIHSAQARQLLRNKKAAIYRRFPFTIIFKELHSSPVQPLRLKLDPGAKTTGIALANDSTGEVIFAAELKHRGFAIRDALIARRQLRRGRRNRKTRYRKPRFINRTKPQGWLAPSLMSRVHNVETWVNRLRKFAPITAISTELVKFDMQLMRNPEIEGKEYQQGALTGYETREYLLEKWNRQCAYCGVKDVPLQIEHIHPRSKGGSNSITNLALSCEKCNIKKGTKDIKDFLKKDPTKLEKILAQAKKPLADAAAVNATRYKLLEVLKSTGLHVECGSGGLTKFNRTSQKLIKTHWIDAACVGKSTPTLNIKGIKPLLVTANGHGTRQMAGTDKFGFPIRHRSNKQIHFEFQTGDIIKAVVTSGKKVGEYVGRVLCRATGSFDIATKTGRISGINHKYCSAIHKKDGYSYAF
ncbi:RRXRR domain-containing protein [Calothrix sp. FACHB-1219]|uniref:RNA-guided endonuclease IscB n=1 Tax=unclassified Calothrix TaxID=2619626 RepID=UPI001685A222|nr:MULTISPECIES: RNA-guided endonuclease IscB [unclassified Calothrix]MBD2202653.1 RRXRR domain-containing protein [Calothrix sp. FACHB-168]MBD2221717.1 RRXRR domain-containing protein [Calothrix sp. FACHB-1219]